MPSLAPSRLEARGLGLSRRGRSLLADVSLRLPATGTVAIIGPNGAGKSTLLSLLAGLVPAERGDVLLDGRPIGTLPVAERARAIGFMPQRFEPHWDLTPQELLGLRPAQVPADEVLAREGLGALRDRRWSTLSGGEQARVLLAMVLAPDPPILLADEPGASLDVRHRLALVEALAERGRTRLVVVAMHDLDLAFAHFKHIVVVAEGAIAATGGAELAHAPLLDRVFGVRFERIGTAPDLVLRARRAAEQGAA